MICKHCKTENKDGTTYCSNCGKPMTDEYTYVPVPVKGEKVYIGISIALMVLLAGGLVFGFFYFSSKVQKANEERNAIASESDVAAQYFKSQLSVQEDTIAELQTEIASLSDAVEGYKDEIADYQEQVYELQNRNEAIDGLATFTDALAPQGYEDMFVSDTVLHLKEEAIVRVCITGAMEVRVTSDNPKIVACEWDSVPVGPTVARLRLKPRDTGSAIITLTNNRNNEEIYIYVYVD